MRRAFLNALQFAARMQHSEIREIGSALRTIEKGLNAILIAALLVFPSAAAAENMSDPMRPPMSGAAVERNSGEPRWQVTGILISPERRLAMINNRLIGVGERVDGARVRSILSNSVELDIDGRSVVLRPVAGSVRRDP